MPKLPRKRRQVKETVKAAPKRAVKEPELAGPGWPTTERIRVRCVCCGMLPEDFRLEAGPYPLEVKRQIFGGKGYLRYDPAPELLEEWKPKMVEKLRAALQLLGEE